MDANDLRDIEDLMSRVVKEASTAASIESLKNSHHNYPSDACQNFMKEIFHALDTRLGRIELRLDNIEADIKSILADHLELDKRVNAHDEAIKDLKRFQSVQKGMLRVLWAVVSAWIIGGGFLLFRLLGERLVGGR